MDLKKIILTICRILVGCLFVFSGFVKAVDPFGTAYKIVDYFEAMPLLSSLAVAPWMDNFAFWASICLAAFEFTVGMGLFLGVRLRECTFGASLLMLVMTPLTFWIAVSNPVSDCGCFGDALVISNWATFFKNIVLCVLIAGIWWSRRSFKGFFSRVPEWVVIVVTIIFSVGVSLYGYKHLPILDFRPYHVGANIQDGMAIPDNAEPDSFDVKLIYSKNGEEKEFTIDNYPTDPSWKFVDQRSVLVKKGYEPPIHDFSISYDGNDITDAVLNNNGYTFLLVSTDLNKVKLSKRKNNNINNIYEYAKSNGYDFYMLTASMDEDIADYRKRTGAKYPIAESDKIALKTVIRSNPGLVLIKNATVVNKWASADIPQFKAPLQRSEFGKVPDKSMSMTIFFCALIFFVPIILIVVINKMINNRRD